MRRSGRGPTGRARGERYFYHRLNGYDIIIPVLMATGRKLRVAAAEKRTVSLPAEQATYIESLVASGAYASASEVVRAGLRALQERDAAVERWLRDEVVPVYDAMHADPQRALSAEDVFEMIRARHAERLKTRRRGA